MTERYGLRSALFVSSQSHISRSCLIAEDVSDSKRYPIALISTRVEPPPAGLRRYHPERIAGVARECMKILRFQAHRYWMGRR